MGSIFEQLNALAQREAILNLDLTTDVELEQAILNLKNKIDNSLILKSDIIDSVHSVAGKQGDVILNNNDVSGVAPISSPEFLGTPAVQGKGNILTEMTAINGGYF
jgi:hypothetical protein